MVLIVEEIVEEIKKVLFCKFDEEELDYKVKVNLIYAQITSCLNISGIKLAGFHLLKDIFKRFFQNVFSKTWLLQYSVQTLEEKLIKIKSDRKRNKQNSLEKSKSEESPKRGRDISEVISPRKKSKNLSIDRRSRTRDLKKKKKKITKSSSKHRRQDDSEEELSDS